MDQGRRQLLVWAAAAPVVAGLGAVTKTASASGDPSATVDRWLATITRKAPMSDLEQFMASDAVVVLHGIGANEDGTPRRIEGREAIRGWVEKLQARQAEPPDIRVDDRLVDGNKMALRGRNVWVLRNGSEITKVAQSVAGFYYVENDKIVLIERYVGGIRPKVG